MAFEIGDKVIVSMALNRSEKGIVWEVLKGTASDTRIYGIKLKNGESTWAKEEDVAPAYVEQNFTFEVDIPSEKNIVIVKMMADGKEIGRGHGHLIHAGATGIAQAMSYACRRIWNDLTYGKSARENEEDFEEEACVSEKSASVMPDIKKIKDTLIEDLPISKRAKSTLIRNNITDVKTALEYGPERLRELRGVGAGIVSELKMAVQNLMKK